MGQSHYSGERGWGWCLSVVERERVREREGGKEGEREGKRERVKRKSE